MRGARVLLGGAALLAVGLVLLARLGGEAPAPDEPPAGPAASPAPTPEPAAPPPPTPEPTREPAPNPRVASGPGPHAIDSGATLVVDLAALGDVPRVALALRMPPEAIGDEPPPVRVVAPDGRLLHGQGTLGEPDSVGFALDPTWLRPGRYLIEVKTAERSHFPLRRYAVEVR